MKKERVYLCLQFILHQEVRARSQGRKNLEEETEAAAILLTGFLSAACSICSLIKLKAIYPGTALPTLH